MSEYQRLELDLPDKTGKELLEIQERTGLTVTEITRRAIAVYSFLDYAKENGKGLHISANVDQSPGEEEITLLTERKYFRLLDDDTLLFSNTRERSTLRLE